MDFIDTKPANRYTEYYEFTVGQGLISVLTSFFHIL